MRESIKLGLILFLITAISATILGVSNDMTKGVIAEVELKASEEARKEILSQADEFKVLDEELMKEILKENDRIIEIYSGYANNELVGYAIKTKNVAQGYGGDIEIMIGISVDGKIAGMKVVKHSETPGLGANSTKPGFQNQYQGKDVNEEIIVVKTEPSNENEIQALTGATITSRAVTSGVNNAREIFNTKLSK